VAQVPVARRPDFDRWLLSNLQLLVKEAHKAYASYNVMGFALACEKFIEGDLSNWYVRRNKDRLHSRNVDLDDAGRKDKLAAYQTLYTTLTTLCKLMAPCVPFVTDVMWKNLRLPTDRESVHLCDFPVADESLVDDALSRDMEAVQAVITLGLSARQAAKLNVRQPLAELVAATESEEARHAVTRFPDIITDELNVKAVRLHDAIAGPFPPSATGWQVIEDRGTQVAINTTITEELKLEGLARDVIRQVQNARKTAGLDLSDKIALSLTTDAAELAKAIRTHQKDVATATQAVQWSDTPLAGDGVHSAAVKIDGQTLTISIRKVKP